VPQTHTSREIEIKLRVAGVAAARHQLEQAEFRVARKRVFESNLIYDTKDLALRRAGSLLRVRQAGRISTLTYKGRDAPGKYKSREELEVEISAGKTLAAILERLGFSSVFRYEKFRTEYAQPGTRGVATLDETPIGAYIELEGSPRWIDRTARLLGFDAGDYITASYGALYLEFCKKNHLAPRDMVFKTSGPVRRRAARRSAGRPPE
jgi:adenylate cyclase class 2